MGLFSAGPGADLSFGGKRADVVPEDIAFAVVDVVALAAAAEDQIFLNQHSGGALVEVYAPAAVTAFAGVRRHVVDHVAGQLRAGLDTEHIDAAHVREPTLPDVIDQVVADLDVVRQVVGVAPGPAAGDGGIISVADFVMGDLRSVAVGDMDADGAEELPAVA